MEPDIYESWRQMRDFFYAPNMHGVDWKPCMINMQCSCLMLTSALTIDYIIGEMIGELSVGHFLCRRRDIPSMKESTWDC